ncbi:MAG: protein-disulfide reductase DsbD [Gammaproteobacteria bacterium]
MGRRQRLGLTAALLAALCALGPGPAGAGVLDQLERLGGASSAREFLPPDEAFRLTDRVDADGNLVLDFAIEPGYYLYRERFAFSTADESAVLGEARLPESESKDDPEFGRVEVYKHDMRIAVPVREAPPGAVVEVAVRYQGCAEDGICYPPITKTVAWQAPAGGAAAALPAGAAPGAVAAAGTHGLSATDRIARELGERSLTVTLATFLGLGLLLALTPCVFPMVPILSGIIVGQRQPLSTPRALGLSAVYVLAMAATYAVAGVAAGLLGQNLQAAFQHPAVIAGFAALFVALALSMFGFYELQLPAALQSRLDGLSRSQKSGSLAGVAVMGVLSAVIVGPCVAPPLAGALAYIGTTGSAVTGGAALFALGLGMGLPLLAVGASAGALLPRAGAWMKRVKQVFGVVFLGVAVWFLERILPAQLTLLLWAALLLGSAVALGALTRTDRHAGAAPRLAQALGLACLLWGGALVVGAAGGADDPLRPLAPFAGTGPAGHATAPPAAFRPVKQVAEIDQAVRAAPGPVMLDVYADWCVECKHLERETFAAPAVAARLAGYTLLRADVTANDDTDRALLARFGLYGPPAVLFFRDGAEQRAQRLVGFVDAAGFTRLLDDLERP